MSAQPKPDPASAVSLEIDVTVDAPGWAAALADVEALARRAAEAAFQAASSDLAAGAYEVSIVLGDDAAVHVLNRDWRGKDKPTNVLSFPALDDDAPGPDAERLLGDVVVALETTGAEAERDGKTLADHLSHLVVHGMLHLLGHDHETDAEADRMEGLEKDILAGLGIADPYAEGASAPDA